MIGLIFTCVLVTFFTWTVVDVYFSSVLFDPVRNKGTALSRSDVYWRSMIGYGLVCSYCLSHWIAAIAIMALFLFPTQFASNLTFLEAILLIPICARLSGVLRENILEPIVPLVPPEIGNNSDGEVKQTSELLWNVSDSTTALHGRVTDIQETDNSDDPGNTATASFESASRYGSYPANGAEDRGAI